jgi:hypothetical protein
MRVRVVGLGSRSLAYRGVRGFGNNSTSLSGFMNKGADVPSNNAGRGSGYVEMGSGWLLKEEWIGA